MSANEQAPKWVWIWTDEPYQWHTTKSAESDVKYVRYSDYEQLQSRLAQVEKERINLEQATATCRDCDRCAPFIAAALKEKP